MRVHPAILVVLGLLAGLAVADRMPEARAASSTWACYVVDRLDDLEGARARKGSEKAAQGLNTIAASVPVGTTIAAQYPTAAKDARRHRQGVDEEDRQHESGQDRAQLS